MAEFIIKKRVSLDFLGEDYKDSYLTFKTIPIVEYEEMFKVHKKVTNLEATKVAFEVIKQKFVEGKMIDATGVLQDVTVDQLESFMDESTLNECYLTILGQKPDPKS